MARVPLAYPKMPNSSAARLEPCIAFEKYDGTNLHWVWEPELGWYAFGTRRDRFDLDNAGITEFARAHPGLEEAPVLFHDTLDSQLSEFVAEHDSFGADELIVFTEFLGENSFAGQHVATDKKKLIILDMQVADEFMPPHEFVEQFTGLPIARVIYRGKFNGQFATDVREGRFDVDEGVVCKGGKTGDVWMVKIKTNAYMEKLKASFKDDWTNFWE